MYTTDVQSERRACALQLKPLCVSLARTHRRMVMHRVIPRLVTSVLKLMQPPRRQRAIVTRLPPSCQALSRIFSTRRSPSLDRARSYFAPEARLRRCTSLPLGSTPRLFEGAFVPSRAFQPHFSWQYCTRNNVCGLTHLSRDSSPLSSLSSMLRGRRRGAHAPACAFVIDIAASLAHCSVSQRFALLARRDIEVCLHWYIF